jgi:hypothetical protein
MKVTSPRSICHRIVLASCAVLLAACSSSSSDNNNAPTTPDGFGAKYKLADNEIQGWTQSTDSDGYTVYSDVTLTDKIDGAATPYVQHGMKLAMYQNIVGPNQATGRVMAMDFVTATQAQSMVSQRVSDQGADLPIPGYDASVALAWTTIGGITAVASFKALYLEIIISGVGDDTASAQTAAQFLQAMQAKTK